MRGALAMAEPHRQTITVQVKDKVLWIGSDAYPVQNIARAQARKLIPGKRQSPVWPFVKTLARWLVVGIVASIVVALAHLGSRWNAVVWLVVLVFIAFAVVRMIRDLRKRDIPYYSLLIETAGTPREALISDSEEVINTIIGEIMRAINGEPVDWRQPVNNFYGDFFNQFGDHNVGKVQR
jgi:hypothetical protein